MTLTTASPRPTDLNVHSFGATGDGVTLDTEALQAAINACHAQGGGRVVLPAGRYLTAPLRLLSHVELHLLKDAILLGSLNPGDYANFEHPDFNPEGAAYNSRYLLLAYQAENVAITGEGSIDGQGFIHYDRTPATPPRPFWPIIDRSTRPGRMIWFLFCQGVRVEGASFHGSPAWTFLFSGCERVAIEGITITAYPEAINTDGIDIDACRDVIIRHCTITTGDDCIVLRSIDRLLNQPRLCENVQVENCSLISYCNAIRLSYLYDGAIRNATFRNITIRHSYRGIICQLPAPEGTPEGNQSLPRPENLRVENITFENIDIEAWQPIWFLLSDRWSARRLANFRFENLVINGVIPSLFQGNAETPLQNVTLQNVAFHLRPDLDVARHGQTPPCGPAAALHAAHCENLSLVNISVEGHYPSAPEAPLLTFEAVRNLHLAPFLNATSHPDTGIDSSDPRQKA